MITFILLAILFFVALPYAKVCLLTSIYLIALFGFAIATIITIAYHIIT